MRLIDADALIKKLNEERIPYNADVNYFITNTPTIDREDVRCIECGYCDGKEYPYTYCNLIKLHVPEDGYCHMGVWKEGVEHEED